MSNIYNNIFINTTNNLPFMETFIKKIYKYYEYVMGYEKNYNINIELENLNLEDLEMDAYEISWVKQYIGRLMFQEEVFENIVSDKDDKDNNFSYGEFLTKNPHATHYERITALRKFYKCVGL